jgi:SAM-dependent methyltransferase
MNSTSTTLQWADTVAATFYGSYAMSVEQRVLLQAQTLARYPTTALEIGCDGGRWAQLLTERGWRMTCTDIYRKPLAICQQRLPEATCIHVRPDDCTLPCADASMGLISCIQVFPALHANWFMSEAFRVLSPGGVLVGTCLNRASYRGFLYHHVRWLRMRESGAWYWYPEAYRSWRNRLLGHGFTLLHEEGYCWPPFRRSSNSPLVPIATRIERYLVLNKLVCLSPLVVFIAKKV